MLTLEQALADQKDIEALIQPVSENRFERYQPNDNYGFAYVMKKYAGYPIEKSILATFPHGMYMRDRVLPSSELKAPFNSHLNFPPFLTPLWKKTAKQKKIIPFAAPVHYALRQFKSEVKTDDRRGTLFLPMHSTFAVDVEFDKEAVIEELENLPEFYHPITVCVHWNDVKKGMHTYFKDKGFEVVCAGHISDYQYIYRWLHLASRHKLVAHCGIGSAIFYSILAGIPFYLTKQDAKTSIRAGLSLFNKNSKEYSAQALQRESKLREVFSVVTDEITSEQLDLVNYYTSADLIKSPKELFQLFTKLEKG